MKSNKKLVYECEDIEAELRWIFKTENMVAAIRDKKIESLERFFTIPKIKKIFSNVDMVYTLKQFLINDLNLAKTSLNSFLHRNTVIYRINKMSRVTGLDVRKFDDAILLHNMIYVLQFLNLDNTKDQPA